MNPEEVIKNIDEIQEFITENVPVCDPNDDWNRYTGTLNMAKRAVEKEMARKPESVTIYERTETIGMCPVCSMVVTAQMKYCDECGQKIDWSESNE